MPDQDIFKKFVNKLAFEVSDYLDDSHLSNFQKKLIDDATFIFKDNIIGDIKQYGGNFENNSEKLENFIKEAEQELDNEEFKESAKDLKQFLKDYGKKLRDLIAKTCVASIPVKEMPWENVLFRSVPRILIEDDTISILDNAIAYYGEIKCVISRSTIHGKMKDNEPLFAPLMGDLDLGDYKLEVTDNSPKSQIYPYVTSIINSLDSSATRSQLGKYHEGYQRHGEPICDFLMNKKDLLAAMEKLNSGLESNRVTSDIAITAIAIPLPSDITSLILVTDEGKDSAKFSRCFEGVLRFSAACCEAPSASPAEQPQTGAVTTPGGQELKEWTADDLAKEAQQRGTNIPSGLEEWSEEDLTKMAGERGGGIPEGMEVWTEEELEELSRKRQGGLDIPEWEPDQELEECSKCGYSLRKGWSKCPICETPVGSGPTPSDDQDDESSEETSEDNPDDPEF